MTSLKCVSFSRVWCCNRVVISALSLRKVPMHSQQYCGLSTSGIHLKKFCDIFVFTMCVIVVRCLFTHHRTIFCLRFVRFLALEAENRGKNEDEGQSKKKKWAGKHRRGRCSMAREGTNLIGILMIRIIHYLR